MSIMLATLCLNEIEWLPALYAQHKHWPEVTHWVFVEAADREYQRVNPNLVSSAGLSVDGTSEFLSSLGDVPDTTSRIQITYVAHGICSDNQRDQGKVQARQRYMRCAEEYKPTFIFVLDADEFYTREDQERITEYLHTARRDANAFLFKQRHIWRPESIQNEYLFKYEVIGGYWSVPHIRGWRYIPGSRYNRNHNWIEDSKGNFLSSGSQLQRWDKTPETPYCVHTGYASYPRIRDAKHEYYIARGEGSEAGSLGRKRKMYVECREAYKRWSPGDTLPHGAKVQEYLGHTICSILTRDPNRAFQP